MRRTVATDTVVDLVNGRLSPEESLEVLRRIEADEDASARLDVAVGLTALAATAPDAFSAEVGLPRDTSLGDRVAAFVLRLRDRVRIVVEELASGRSRRIWGLGIAGAAFIVGLLVIVAGWQSGGFAGLVDLDGVGVPVQFRGSVGAELWQVQALAAEGEYETAGVLLERRLRMFPDVESADYLHYLAGAFALLSAERNGVFARSFDRTAVARAEGHLRLSLATTASVRLADDARWLLAQCYLAREDVASARAELVALAAAHGTRADQAWRQLREIDRRSLGR